jgi:hypothetical protein
LLNLFICLSAIRPFFPLTIELNGIYIFQFVPCPIIHKTWHWFLCYPWQLDKSFFIMLVELLQLHPKAIQLFNVIMKYILCLTLLEFFSNRPIEGPFKSQNIIIILTFLSFIHRLCPKLGRHQNVDHFSGLHAHAISGGKRRKMMMKNKPIQNS